MIRVALDVLGGDRVPGAPIEGALAALEAWPDEATVVLVGPPDLIRAEVGRELPPGLEVLSAEQRIAPEEPPALAVRRKPLSSIVVGLEALREGRADAFISGGSTGAVMAASVLTLGVLPGVDRPPVGALFPTARGRVLVLDAGANVNCRPQHLRQFAHLGATYMRDLLGLDAPRVALLNVGEEAEKGDDLAVAAYQLLAEDEAIDFVGNVEGHRIIDGTCDVLVCDGFVGNALLKFYESMARFIMGVLRDGGVLDAAELEKLLRFLDYAEYGGAPLLGVNGVSIICHGSSPPRAFKNAVRTAIDAVASDMVADMQRDLEVMTGGSGE